MISLVIDQSQPGVFYLQKMMNFMKMRTFYKKLPLFIKNSILHTYKKFKPQIWAFIKNSIFGTFRDPCHKCSDWLQKSIFRLGCILVLTNNLLWGWRRERTWFRSNWRERERSTTTGIPYISAVSSPGFKIDYRITNWREFNKSAGNVRGRRFVFLIICGPKWSFFLVLNFTEMLQ